MYLIDQIVYDNKKTSSLVFLTNKYNLYRYLYQSYLFEKIWGRHDIWTDRWIFYLLKYQYKFFNSFGFRVNYRSTFFKKGFYMLFQNTNSLNFFKNNLTSFLSGWRYFFQLFSKWFLPLLLTITYVFYSMYMQYLPLARIAFVWISLFSILYLLISGFVFFFKKYQYGKFTSVIQRFWKRSLILFWLIEGSLLVVFFYLTLNSTWYLYNVSDQSQVFRGFLFSWRLFLLKIIPNTLLILLTVLLLLNNKWQTISKNTLLVITITSLVIYITWIEFYQYYHLINYFHGKTWFYTKEQVEWVVEQDLRKTLSSKSLLNIMLILKFWHVLFVAGMWIFFVLRSFESDRVRYPLIAGNLLNFIMLYILAWVHMYPWFKFFPRKYASYSYKWFYQNNRTLGIRLFFNDLQLFLMSFTDIHFICKYYFNLKSFSESTFFFFKPANYSTGFVDFNKRFVSHHILNELIYMNNFNKSYFETILGYTSTYKHVSLNFFLKGYDYIDYLSPYLILNINMLSHLNMLVKKDMIFKKHVYTYWQEIKAEWSEFTTVVCIIWDLNVYAFKFWRRGLRMKIDEFIFINIYVGIPTKIAYFIGSIFFN